MRVKCHQMMRGHSIAQSYNAPMIESRDTTKPGCPKSFSFSFNDDRRSLPDNDSQTYVLEIEPVNSNFDCTAAICTQYTDVGTPTLYTNWLVPENGLTQTTLQILERKNFMCGQDVVDVYENGKLLGMREFEISDQKPVPDRQMTDDQKKLLGQFLTLYWVSLVQSKSAINRSGNRLLLVLREPGSSELMTNEKAVHFFSKEIVPRLPLEAQSMISAVFGVKKVEAERNFQKAVCVVLSSETGIPPEGKIDLLNGTQDIFRRIPSLENREAMKAISACLLGGEQNYPPWYLRLRRLKNGIPKIYAPYIMAFCYKLQLLETGDFKPINPHMHYEQCYKNIYAMLIGGGVSEDEANNILQPLVVEISRQWCDLQHIDMDLYRSKREWLLNEAKIPQKSINEFLSDLANRFFTETAENTKISLNDKIVYATELMRQYQDEPVGTFDIQKALEQFLSNNFEEWIFSCSETEPENLFCESCFTRIISNWNSSGLRRDPGEVKEKLLPIIEQYKGIRASVTKNALMNIDKLRLKALLKGYREQEQRGELVQTTELEVLANQIVVVGRDEAVEDITRPAMEFIRKNLSLWVLTKPVYIQGDIRFFELLKELLTGDLKSFDDCTSEQLKSAEKNAIQTMADYEVGIDEQNRLLVGLRRKIGKKQIEEIETDDNIDDVKKALKIASVHRFFRRVDGVLQDDDELSRHLNEVMSERFLDWSKTEKPFVASEELRYDDNWFVSVAENWLKEQLRDYILGFNADDLQNLESTIKTVFDVYRVSEERKSCILQQMRIAKFDARLTEVNDSSTMSKEQMALQIAGIHNELRKMSILLDETENLVSKLQDAILPLFYDWSHTEKPFSSSEDLRYEDNWFIDVTQQWMDSELEQVNLNAEELDGLQNSIADVLTVYKVSKDDQGKLLLPLRRKWALIKLDEQYDVPSDYSEKAICIADIHNRVRQYPGVLQISDELSNKLQETMRDCFLAWEKADKPFVSGYAGRYEDSWFVEVAGDWLLEDLPEARLDSAQLEQLEKDLTEVFGYYHQSKEQQKGALLPLRAAWCRAKLDGIRQEAGNDFNAGQALCIAGIHTKLVHQIGIQTASEQELEKDLQSALRDCFVAWSGADKPFASGPELRYEDGQFFESVTTDWLNYDMMNAGLDSSQMEELEAKLKTVFGIYKIFHEKQNKMLLDLRKAWGTAKIQDIQSGTMSKPQQAVHIAGIHNRLRQISGALEPQSELSYELEMAMLELFPDWERAEKPFASSEQLRYEDDWFVRIAELWLHGNTSTDNMDDGEISRLEENFVKVFNTYKVPKVKQNELLCTLRLNKCIARLSYLQQNAKLEDPLQALNVASVHAEYRQIISGQADVDPAIENEFLIVLRERFVAWSQVEKPFASVLDLKYCDEFFITVAEQWLSCDLPDTTLSAEQLGVLEIKLKSGLAAYRVSREKQQEMMLPLRLKWGEAKLREILADPASLPEEKALCIADIHSKLKQIININTFDNDLKLQLENFMLEYFVDWSNCEKPFASGFDMRFDDPWFRNILQKWCDVCMPSSDLSADEFSILTEKIEEAANFYRLRDWEDIRKRVREKNAEICIDEESGLASSSEEAICKIAEMLFRGDTGSDSDELFRKAIIFVAENFDKWAMTQPSFRLPNSTILSYQANGKGILLELLRNWKNTKLVSGNIDVHNVSQLRERIQHICNIFHIPVRDYENELHSLDQIISYQAFETIRNGEITPQAMVSLAGIRKRLEDLNVDSSSEWMNEMLAFLKANMIEWANADQPLYVEGYGYKDRAVPSIVEDWVKHDLPMREWNGKELEHLKNQFTEASEQYRMVSGKEISPDAFLKLDILACDVYIRELPNGIPSKDDLPKLAGWLNRIPKEEETVVYGIKDLLARQFVTWINCQPPFVVEENGVNRADLTDIACLWVERYMQPEQLSSLQLKNIFDKLKSAQLFRESEKGTKVFNSVELRIMEQRLLEIRMKEDNVSGDDMIEIATFIDRTIQRNEFDKVRDAAHNELMTHFALWGTDGAFRLFPLEENQISNIRLDELIEEWLQRNDHAPTSEIDFGLLRRNFDSVISRQNYIDDARIHKIDDLLLNYEAKQLLSVLQNRTQICSESNLSSAMNLYRLLSAQGKTYNENAVLIKEALLDKYDLILDFESVVDGEMFVSITDAWLRERLPRKNFESFEKIQDLKAKIEEKYKTADSCQKNRLEATFEILRMCKAMDRNEGEGMSVSIPEIAATEARIKAYGIVMEPQYADILRTFLLEKFDRWAIDGFRSEYDNNVYSYSCFPGLVREWLGSANYSEYSVKRLETLTEKLHRALEDGYGMSRHEVDQLVAPIETAQKEALLKQVKEHPTEENISDLKNLYVEDPARYFDRVFEVYQFLAYRGISLTQISEFLELQAQIWEDNDTLCLRRGIVQFLNNMWGVYGNRQPDELQSTMSSILEKENYHFDFDMDSFSHWIELKNRKMEHIFNSFLKRCNDPSSLEREWKERKKELGITWTEITEQPFFERCLMNWLNSMWQGLQQDSEQMEFISKLYDVTYCVSDKTYRDTLIRILFQYIEEKYQTLSVNYEWQDALDDVLQFIQDHGVSIDSVRNSVSYFAGAYRKQYVGLLSEWNVQSAEAMLYSRPKLPMELKKQMPLPAKTGDWVRWLLLVLAHEAPFTSNGEYWNAIMHELGTPKLDVLNKMDLKDVATTPFIQNMQWCFDNIPGKGDSWLAEDLKQCLKVYAPDLWSGMHQGLFSSGIKKLVKDGWRGLPEEFSDWLKDKME